MGGKRHSAIIIIALLSLPAVVALPARAESSATACRPIEGLEPLLQRGKTLFLGEIHGTSEIPGFAAEVICHAVQSDFSVLVGLELPQEEKPRLQRYLNSPGEAPERIALLAGTRWQSEYQDGRTSEAMLAFLERLRGFREEGKPIRLEVFDEPSLSQDAQQRDRDMAITLGKILRNAREDLTIILTGNLHSQLAPFDGCGTEFTPMAYLVGLDLSFRDLVSVTVDHTGGTAWICGGPDASDCGVRDLAGNETTETWKIKIEDSARGDGIRARVNIGSITASPPAAWGLPGNLAQGGQGSSGCGNLPGQPLPEGGGPTDQVPSPCSVTAGSDGGVGSHPCREGH